MDMKALLAKKIGMINIFDETGLSVPVTVIEAGPCYITQIKTVDKDGYSAVQVGFLPKKEKKTTKPLLNHFAKAKIKPLRKLKEFKLDDNKKYNLGDILGADIFSAGEKISVTGFSKGRGFAGVMKRHGFSGAQRTHGQSDRLRAPGSIGQSSSPSRVLKGMKMPGRMGNSRVTIKNLKIIKVNVEKNLIYVMGGVPGANNGILEIIKK